MVSNILYFHPYLGKVPMLTNIFQMGWNHQLESTRAKISVVFLSCFFSSCFFRLMFAYCMCQGLKSLFLTPEESCFCEVWNESLCVETGIFVVNQGSRIDLFKFVTDSLGFAKDVDLWRIWNLLGRSFQNVPTLSKVGGGSVSCQDDGIWSPSRRQVRGFYPAMMCIYCGWEIIPSLI